MNRYRARLRLGVMCLAGLPAGAFAGDEIVYDQPPAWVEERAIDTAERTDQSVLLLLDQQARIDEGRLWTYVDTAFALDTPQALTQLGTFTASWLPDKGDLIVHSAELIRDGKVIDLVAGGSRFEIIRREQQLEKRALDGILTATMPVSGAQIGDVMRLAYSVTLKDQVLGDDVQWQAILPADPFPLAEGRVKVSWPRDLAVSRVQIGEAEIGQLRLDGGFYTWSAELPVAERDPVPNDAPGRFQLGDLLQVTTFPGWTGVSQAMAPYYDRAGTVVPGSALADAIARIAVASEDPLERTALALQRVQTDISYLMNGLDGGNYMPQSPEETWENRFGDCKAKSLLLVAMLHELGIEGEAVLVRTSGGDALPMLAPMPGNFDHVIVRAAIGGRDYWLDGTSAGTRLDTIDEVPRFHHALPLRKGGADLIALDIRGQSTPDRIVRLSIDHSAGLRLPSLFDATIEYRGQGGAGWEYIAGQASDEERRAAVGGEIASIVGESQLIDEAVTYDADTGVAVLTARGIQTSGWQEDGSQYEWAPPAQAAQAFRFEADRARAAWRDIPLKLDGPLYFSSELDLRLPGDPGGFELEGNAQVAETIGGVELSSAAALTGERFTLSQTMRTVDPELPADRIGQARGDTARFKRALPVLRSSDRGRAPWEYRGKDRALLARHQAMYAETIEQAEPDDPNALISRANFRSGVLDFAGALEDAEAAHAIEASYDTYYLRAYLRYQTGDYEGALADYRLAEDLDPDGTTYAVRVDLLALLGRVDEAMALAEDFGALVDDSFADTSLKASALGWAGSPGEALDLLDEFALRRPGDGDTLNAICWTAGIWNRIDAERLATCTQAVENSEYSAAVLDSRALAQFRLGNLDAARADIDAALLAEPGLAASHFLRGLIRVAQGDDGGREDVDLALAMQPSLGAIYAMWGLELRD